MLSGAGKNIGAEKEKKYKIQKDMLRADAFTPQKKRDQVAVPALKKRDCTIAVPLIEALVLPFVTNSNTVAHAVCIVTSTHTVHARHYTP